MKRYYVVELKMQEFLVTEDGVESGSTDYENSTVIVASPEARSAAKVYASLRKVCAKQVPAKLLKSTKEFKDFE